MKITKRELRRIIAEELEALEEFGAGGAFTAPPRRSGRPLPAVASEKDPTEVPSGAGAGQKAPALGVSAVQQGSGASSAVSRLTTDPVQRAMETLKTHIGKQSADKKATVIANLAQELGLQQGEEQRTASAMKKATKAALPPKR